MGQVKQLLPYRGHTLVEHAIQQAREAKFEPIVVVVGAQAELVCEAVARTSAYSAMNENWQQGMGSSIKSGLRQMLKLMPDIQAVAMLVADQPYVSARHLLAMKQALDCGDSEILAANYAGTLGVPALFRRSVFDELANLPSGAGARTMLRNGGSVSGYLLPEGITDVDTPDDFAALR